VSFPAQLSKPSVVDTEGFRPESRLRSLDVFKVPLSAGAGGRTDSNTYRQLSRLNFALQAS
jgi:hypothetical protein